MLARGRRSPFTGNVRRAQARAPARRAPFGRPRPSLPSPPFAARSPVEQPASPLPVAQRRIKKIRDLERGVTSKPRVPAYFA